MKKFVKEMKSLWNNFSRLAVRSLALLFCVWATSCVQRQNKLPIFGEQSWNGKDSVYHTIASFQFVDQDSTLVTNSTFDGKIYVADFFFTSCRTICPIMKTQMFRVYEATEKMPDVLLLSHTIDPEY